MKLDTKAVAATLNKILEFELAGTVRYTHYSLMTYGYNRNLRKPLNRQPKSVRPRSTLQPAMRRC